MTTIPSRFTLCRTKVKFSALKWVLTKFSRERETERKREREKKKKWSEEKKNVKTFIQKWFERDTMSHPTQFLSRHRKTPLPPVVPARQTIVSWTTTNQNRKSRRGFVRWDCRDGNSSLSHIISPVNETVLIAIVCTVLRFSCCWLEWNQHLLYSLKVDCQMFVPLNRSTINLLQSMMKTNECAYSFLRGHQDKWKWHYYLSGRKYQCDKIDEDNVILTRNRNLSHRDFSFSHHVTIVVFRLNKLLCINTCRFFSHFCFCCVHCFSFPRKLRGVEREREKQSLSRIYSYH